MKLITWPAILTSPAFLFSGLLSPLTQAPAQPLQVCNRFYYADKIPDTSLFTLQAKKPSQQPKPDFQPLPRLDSLQTVYGIDMSKYQGRLFAEIHHFESLHFVLCKATEGVSITDPEFYYNWHELQKRNIVRGAYHFYQTKDPPEAQAKHFMKVTGPETNFSLPFVVDIESASIGAGKPARKWQSDLLVFLKYIEGCSKRRPVIYSNYYFACQYLKDKRFARYPLWLAHYTKRARPSIPPAWEKKGYVFWQKTDKFSIASAKVDLDVFYGNGKMFLQFIQL